MSDNLSDQFEKLNACLKKFCMAVYDKLQAGLDEDEIADKLEDVNVSSKTVEELFRWRNGIREASKELIGKYELCSHGKLMPLDEAIVHYKTFTRNSLWGENLFPIITNYGGDYLLIDFGRSSPNREALFLYSPNLLLTTPEIAYDNLGNFITTIIECFERGIYAFDAAEAYLAIDHEAEAILSTAKNPRSKVWV